MNGELTSRASSRSNCKDIPTAMLDQLTPFWPGSLAAGAIFLQRRRGDEKEEEGSKWGEDKKVD